ncbi:hypothetical protein [Methylobacterium sp. J-092]|uniref:hypothetical protein n=1 Tax=Methylobacterium sp. J-092 TaxID=2836667 RepID=UPI001FBADB1C|nr:hypothetical protein [Methylobacterium sp. J-092]MCJ2009491.1 hypothetical protein [Methylobacterium sp. J-092]
MSRCKPSPDQFDFDFAPRTPWTPDRLCEALKVHGIITNPSHLSMNTGTLQDVTVPYSPRSYAFPVRVEIVDGDVRLWLRTPAAGSLPFVGRVETALGVRARWDEMHAGVMNARWFHAIDLISEGKWKALLASREHTTDRFIVNAVQYGLEQGCIKPAEARLILGALGIPEPEDRSEPVLFGPKGLRPCRSVCAPNLHTDDHSNGWAMIHAMEDGWVKIVKGHAKVTAAYWHRIDARIAA